MPRSEWSGWTQAAGSVLALAVAVWIYWRQAADLRRTQTVHGSMLVAAGVAALDLHLNQLASLGPKAIVNIDSKFLRDAVQPFDGLMGGALPQRVLASVVATRQLLLTLANDIDDWRGKPVADCSNFRFEVDTAKKLLAAIKNGDWRPR